MNNRQLHPPEKGLAKVLFEKAKKQGLKTADGANYTLQDIEDALRWANSGMYGETYNSNRTVRISNKASQSAIDKVMYDNGVGRNFESRLWLNSKNGNVTTFTQNLSGIKKPDTNLTGFIQRHSPSYKYSWSKGTTVAYQNPTLVLPTSGKKLQAPTYLQSVLEMHNNTTKASNVNISGARTTNSYITDSLGKYGDSVVNTTLSGVNGEIELGGTAVVGLGVRQTTGKVFDTDRKICTTYTTCGLVGPMVGGYIHAGLSGSTGTATPGSRTWQLGYTVDISLGIGGGKGGTINSDGSITGGVEGTMGGALGGAIMICSKKVGETCVNQ